MNESTLVTSPVDLMKIYDEAKMIDIHPDPWEEELGVCIQETGQNYDEGIVSRQQRQDRLLFYAWPETYRGG